MHHLCKNIPMKCWVVSSGRWAIYEGLQMVTLKWEEVASFCKVCIDLTKIHFTSYQLIRAWCLFYDMYRSFGSSKCLCYNKNPFWGSMHSELRWHWAVMSLLSVCFLLRCNLKFRLLSANPQWIHLAICCLCPDTQSGGWDTKAEATGGKGELGASGGRWYYQGVEKYQDQFWVHQEQQQ